MKYVDGAQNLGAIVGIREGNNGANQLWTTETVYRREYAVFIANMNLAYVMLLF